MIDTDLNMDTVIADLNDCADFIKVVSQSSSNEDESESDSDSCIDKDTSIGEISHHVMLKNKSEHMNKNSKRCSLT